MSSSDSPVDYIVVGSGLTGAMAAQTLVEAGAKVLVLDPAYRNEVKPQFPSDDFITIRNSYDKQRELFLGEDFEGIPWGNIKTGAQLTPGRQYIVRDVARYLSILSNSFFPMESLAYGGLGNAWGAGCYIFSDSEFEKMGIAKSSFNASYQTVGDRIGISAGADDALKYTVEGLRNIMPPVQPEASIHGIISRYQKNRSAFNSRGFFAGIPAVAILTKEKEERKAFSYSDLDFWHDKEQSVYRPWMTVDQLKKKQNFQLEEGMMVLRYEEGNDLVKVICKDVRSNKERRFYARKLVLCSGVLGTARIVLRSSNSDATLPLICNPYVYVPMINWRRLGAVPEQRKNGMGQLVMFYDRKRDNSDVPMAAFFTYRSLLLFKLVKESPLNFADGRALMQYLVPAMVISGIHHPESPGPQKNLKLQASAESATGDVLNVNYVLSNDEEKLVQKTEAEFFSVFRKLGIIPVSKVYPGHGASIHYAGTLPFDERGSSLTTSKDGRLNGSKNIFIGDGSSFKYLPAKGISFTLMANADRVARHALNKT